MFSTFHALDSRHCCCLCPNSLGEGIMRKPTLDNVVGHVTNTCMRLSRYLCPFEVVTSKLGMPWRFSSLEINQKCFGLLSFECYIESNVSLSALDQGKHLSFWHKHGWKKLRPSMYKGLLYWYPRHLF